MINPQVPESSALRKPTNTSLDSNEKQPKAGKKVFYFSILLKGT